VGTVGEYHGRSYMKYVSDFAFTLLIATGLSLEPF